MEPISIAAIVTGATALIASAGSCLAPLFRKQKNSVNQTSTETDQDVVTVSYGGDAETTWSCWGWSYSKKQTPMLVFNSKETNTDHDVTDASREARGYQHYTSSQPRTSAPIIPSTAPNLAPPTSLDSQQGATITAEDDAPLGDVDVQHLSTIIDKRNHYDIGEITCNSDGSFSIKGIKADIAPPHDPNAPKNTQIGRDITTEVLAPLKAMVAALTHQKLLHATRESEPTHSDSEHAPLLSPNSAIQLVGTLHQGEEA